MEGTQLFLLIAIVAVLIGGFVFGQLYVTKKLKEGKSLGKVILLPLVIGFLLALGLIVVAIGIL